MWTPEGKISKFLQHTIQIWRKAIKTHLSLHSNLSKFVWPGPKTTDVDEDLVPHQPLLNELLEFAQKFLQYTPVIDWYTVNSQTATYTDQKFTKGIITAF